MNSSIMNAIYSEGCYIETTLVASIIKAFYVIANSADPDQMPHTVASDMGLHCLPQSYFRNSRFYNFWVISFLPLTSKMDSSSFELLTKHKKSRWEMQTLFILTKLLKYLFLVTATYIMYSYH